MDQKKYALIVAGGIGIRIGSATPKQFLRLHGKPILLHTLEAFHRYSADLPIVLVLPENEIDSWKKISSEFNYNRHIVLQSGGETRFQSVRRGLEKISGDGLVAIHDGVRPLVSADIIGASFRLSATHKTAVAAVPLKESLRVVDLDETHAVDRSKYRMIQTPQTFDLQLIREAYKTREDESLTDDASVVERAGHSIFLFEGSYDNIKITTAEDMLVAEAFMNNRNL